MTSINPHRPYRVGYSPPEWSMIPEECAVCLKSSQLIQNGELQIGKNYYQVGVGSTTKWRHWDCLSKSLIQEIVKAHNTSNELKGYANLRLADKTKVDELFAAHKQMRPVYEPAPAAPPVAPPVQANNPAPSGSGGLSYATVLGGRRADTTGGPSGPPSEATATSSPETTNQLDATDNSLSPGEAPKSPESSRTSSASSASEPKEHHYDSESEAEHISLCESDVKIALATIALLESELKVSKTKKHVLERGFALDRSRVLAVSALNLTDGPPLWDAVAAELAIMQIDMEVAEAEAKLASEKVNLERVKKRVLERRFASRSRKRREGVEIESRVPATWDQSIWSGFM